MNLADIFEFNGNFGSNRPTVSDSPLMSNGIAHSVTTETASPCIAEQSTASGQTCYSRKRAFDTITSNAESSPLSLNLPVVAAVPPPSRIERSHASAEIVHTLAFSESDDDGDQELFILQQQQEFLMKQQQVPRKAQTASFVNLQPRTNQPGPLSSMPALGYRSYQPDVLRSIFR